jgi:hypothetical protein
MSSDWSQDPDFKYLAVDRMKLMKEQTQAFDGKKACWVPDEKEGFARADIVSSKGDEITVKIVSSSQVLKTVNHAIILEFSAFAIFIILLLY